MHDHAFRTLQAACAQADWRGSPARDRLAVLQESLADQQQETGVGARPGTPEDAAAARHMRRETEAEIQRIEAEAGRREAEAAAQREAQEEAVAALRDEAAGKAQFGD